MNVCAVASGAAGEIIETYWNVNEENESEEK